MHTPALPARGPRGTPYPTRVPESPSVRFASACVTVPEEPASGHKATPSTGTGSSTGAGTPPTAPSPEMSPVRMAGEFSTPTAARRRRGRPHFATPVSEAAAAPTPRTSLRSRTPVVYAEPSLRSKLRQVRLPRGELLV